MLQRAAALLGGAVAAVSLCVPCGVAAQEWQPKSPNELKSEVGKNTRGVYNGDKGDPNTWDTSLITSM